MDKIWKPYRTKIPERWPPSCVMSPLSVLLPERPSNTNTVKQWCHATRWHRDVILWHNVKPEHDTVVNKSTHFDCTWIVKSVWITNCIGLTDLKGLMGQSLDILIWRWHSKYPILDSNGTQTLFPVLLQQVETHMWVPWISISVAIYFKRGGVQQDELSEWGLNLRHNLVWIHRAKDISWNEKYAFVKPPPW